MPALDASVSQRTGSFFTEGNKKLLQTIHNLFTALFLVRPERINAAQPAAFTCSRANVICSFGVRKSSATENVAMVPNAIHHGNSNCGSQSGFHRIACSSFLISSQILLCSPLRM